LRETSFACNTGPSTNSCDLNKVGGDGDLGDETLNCDEELDTEYGDAGSSNGIGEDSGGGVGVRGKSTDGSLYGDPELADDDDEVNLAGDKRDVLNVKLDRGRDVPGENADCSCRDTLRGCKGECFAAGWFGESHANGRITLTQKIPNTLNDHQQ
jgi:hypothetical protein